jgi:hypothetical protein
MTRLIIMLPYYMGAVMPQLMLSMLTSFILEPMLAVLWRTRRYLADATAVQLTRQPDGLARGLAGLVERGGLIPGGKWAGPLFVVGPEAASARMTRAIHERRQAHLEAARTRSGETGERGMLDEARAYIESQRRMADEAQTRQREEGKPVEPSLIALANAHAEASGATQPSGFTGSGDSGIVSFHPPLAKRMKKLRRMGSSVAEVDLSPQAMLKAAGGPSRWTPLGVVVGAGVFVLMAIAAILMVVALFLMGMLALGACAILMAAVYGLFALIAPT